MTSGSSTVPLGLGADGDADWVAFDCAALLETAVTKTAAKGVGWAMATKVLHMKRPRLVPIMDSLVVPPIGGRTDEFPTPIGVVVSQVRAVARANAQGLEAIAVGLRDLPFTLALARILDAVLWTAHPRSSLHARWAGRRVSVRPKGGRLTEMYWAALTRDEGKVPATGRRFSRHE